MSWFTRFNIAFILLFIPLLTVEGTDLKKPAQVVEAKQDSKESTSKKDIAEIAILDVNNISLPIENDGSVADDARAHYPNGSGNSFLFQGGLAMSGFVNGELRTGWMAKSSLTLELQPGKVGQSAQDSLARFYEVRASDTFGSANYMKWQEAVQQGANFQDLDNDGIYNPNTDRPDFLGDLTYWAAFNDCTSVTQRTPRFQTAPLGIEIHQSVWAHSETDELGDIIFFRYRLTNKSSNQIDSFHFSHWSDPDLGDFEDDLVGSDIPLQLGYCYNSGPDAMYGANPPAFGVKLLQGPIVNSPGDTAFDYRGTYLGTDRIPDAVNLPVSSVMAFNNSDPVLGDPSVAAMARFYQEGCLDALGLPINPETWGIGGSANDDCRFVYNGDPVSSTGWRDNAPLDKRLMVNVGPFTMSSGDTQTIIFAYIVGQGVDELDSITELRQRAQFAESYIGFSLPPIVGIPDEIPLPDGFLLYANYPNPFNPSTTISFELPFPSEVRLTIFDSSGREIRTLLNERRYSGINNASWDGRDSQGKAVASGIYLYRLTMANHSLTRKMLLVK